MFRKVIVGVSGGVDSAVSAFLLKKKGFNVEGVFLKNWDIADETGFCSADNDWIDAQSICSKLKIPIHRVEFVKEYWNDVFQKLLKDYRNGKTPNPDIDCNKYIKFKAFFAYAKEQLSADAIATGHYARSSFGRYLENYKDSENAKLFRATDSFKDQTFFLSQIQQNALRHTMFPIGCMLKSNVKQMAIDNGLEQTVRRKESMGMCFIGKRKFKHFIAEYLEARPGVFIDIDTGIILGEHNGMHNFAIGQGVNLPGLKTKMFAVRKMSDQSTILVAACTNNPALFTNIFYTSQPHWIDASPFSFSSIPIVNFRFQHTKPFVECKLCQTNTGLFVQLNQPVRAIRSGQYATFYNGEECLGSAKILAPGPSMRIR